MTHREHPRYIHQANKETMNIYSKIRNFWEVATCRLVKVYRRYKGQEQAAKAN